LESIRIVVGGITKVSIFSEGIFCVLTEEFLMQVVRAEISI